MKNKNLITESAGDAAKLFGKKLRNILKPIQALAPRKALKNLFNAIEDADPRQIAKLEKGLKEYNTSLKQLVDDAINIGTNDVAGTQLARRIDDITRRLSKTSAGKSAKEATKEASKAAKTAEEQLGIWMKLKAAKEEAEAAGAPRQAIKNLEKDMDALFPRYNWEKVGAWIKKNPIKSAAALLAAGGGVGYLAYGDDDTSSSPKPDPDGGGGGGGPRRACRDSLLKYGCKGENVKELQQKLLDAGEKLPRKGVDGWFGPETKAAVKSFQAANKLKVDGIAGPKTLGALSAAKASEPISEPVSKPISEPVSPSPKEDAGLATDSSRNKLAVANAKAEGDWRGEEDDLDIDLSDQIPESKIQKHYFLKPIEDRNERLENLVFERLVKNATEIR